MSDERSEVEQRTSEDEERSAQSESDETGKDEGPGGDQEQASSGDGEQASGDDGESSEEIDENEDPKAVVQKLEEEGPPEKLEDWPQGKAKYETFGGREGEHGYHEGPEQQLGPSSLRHHEEGGVTIAGEDVDDPDQYKGEPIPGGPTDPEAPGAQGEDSVSGDDDDDSDSGEQDDSDSGEQDDSDSGEQEEGSDQSEEEEQ